MAWLYTYKLVYSPSPFGRLSAPDIWSLDKWGPTVLLEDNRCVHFKNQFFGMLHYMKTDSLECFTHEWSLWQSSHEVILAKCYVTEALERQFHKRYFQLYNFSPFHM